MGGANGWATGDLGRVEAAVGRWLVRGKVVVGKLRAKVVPAGQRRDSRLNMVICPPTQPGVGTSTHARGGSNEGVRYLRQGRRAEAARETGCKLVRTGVGQCLPVLMDSKEPRWADP